MAQLNYFIKNGNQYVMKREYGFSVMIAVAMAALAFVGIYIKETAMFWIFGVLAVLCFASIWSKQVIIDMDKKEIVMKIGFIGKLINIPLQDFQNFELIRIKHYFITTNTSLNLNYLKDGKEKEAMIAQGFTTRAMQNLANEIDEILASNEHS